ncbi:MAG TPA: A/G-specific adenine glycosylase [Terriglobia bacterium]|nr:A/G-specific adenine glycosylase [Terriglobia bacterium]
MPTQARSRAPSANRRRTLLAWFRKNARPLPWRQTKDPYRVWVSEVMLQQTQIATAIPYYQRFLRAFPTVRHLAAARLERVLEVWSGLGYYRRARNLHSAAQKIVQEFHGEFPNEFDAIRPLSGIGRYTAGAVLSIAYNLPYTVLDGNVARVVARLEALRGNLHEPGFRHAVEGQLELMLSRRSPGDFNQALMELGETVCLPRAPRCPACPLRRSCAAFRAGNPERYPAPRPRRATEPRFLAAAVVRRGLRPNSESRIPNLAHVGQAGQLGMVRGLDDGLLGDLWNFPSAFGSSPAKAFARLREKLAGVVRGDIEWGNGGKAVARLRHGITYRAITVDVYTATMPASAARSLRWFRPRELNQAAISQLARKVAATLDKRFP